MKSHGKKALLANLFLTGIVLLLSNLVLAEGEWDTPPPEISQPTSVTDYDRWTQAGDAFVSPAYTPPIPTETSS